MVALSKTAVVIGETLEIYGAGIVPEGGADVRVLFEGVYQSDDGTEERVSRAFAALPDGELVQGGRTLQALRLSRLGPFANPFTVSGRPGVFSGTVGVESVDAGGIVRRSGGAPVTLRVGPSLLIEALEPIEAECGAPAVRALAGIPYRLAVRAVGIKATRFVYELSHVNGASGAVVFEHAFDDGTPVERDTLGDDQLVVFDPVAEGDQFYVAALRVVAYDAQGNSVETALPLSVHRPVEVVFDGALELAERYTPVPVSGCTPGGPRVWVSYGESKTEERQRSVTVTVSRTFAESNGTSREEGWHEGVATGQSSSRSLGSSESESEALSEAYGVDYGQSAANEVSYSSTDGERWAWEMSEGESNTDYAERMRSLYGDVSASTTVGVAAEGSIPGFAKVTGSVSGTVGVRAGGSTAGTEGGSRTGSTSRGWSMGGDASETRGFGSTLTESQSQSVNGAYALTRSRQRSTDDTEARSMGETWDFDRGRSESEIISEGLSESEASTWSESTSVTTTQGTMVSVPTSRGAMFYRQTTRWVKRAEVRAYTLCGAATHAGELQFNQWTWAAEVALGEGCDQPPASKLPGAACLIEPCGG